MYTCTRYKQQCVLQQHHAPREQAAARRRHGGHCVPGQHGNTVSNGRTAPCNHPRQIMVSMGYRTTDVTTPGGHSGAFTTLGSPAAVTSSLCECLQCGTFTNDTRHRVEVALRLVFCSSGVRSYLGRQRPLSGAMRDVTVTMNILHGLQKLYVIHTCLK